MKRNCVWILLIALSFAVGCGEAPVDPGDTAKGPKLSVAEAEQYRAIIPGNRHGSK